MRLWLIGVLAMALSGCITETTGGPELEADPEAALARRVELARQYIGRGDWDNAKRNLELAAEMDDDNPEVHEAFGLVYQSTGEYDRAETSFVRALKVDPGFARARNNYAAFLFFLGRYAEAEEQFEKVTTNTLYSGRPLAFINLGLSRLRLDDKPGAEAAFSRALTMDRRNPIALLEMGYLKLDQGAVDDADSFYGVYRTVVGRQSARGLVLGIEIALAKGDRDAAASYELALRNRYPDSPEYRQYQARRRERGNP